MNMPLQLILAAAAVAAPAAPAELPPVEVQGESSAARESRTVADLLRVLDVFERERARYAPNAELRLRVLPRRDLADKPALELRHGSVREPILLDALGRFAIPADWRQLPADAIVRSRLPDGRLAWMVDVRTPGLPEHTRRLGDLRLECRADLYGGALQRGIKPPAFYALRATTDICANSLVTYGFYADEPVFAAQVTDAGSQTEMAYRWTHGSEMGQSNPLFGLLDWPFALRDRWIVMPDSWHGLPHDALVDLEPMTP
ncbi:MAG: hypothetical protein C0460_02950 [Methylibium sp.]|jgi:hypothetical protein|nr:hypothetical protein [Methylibium sp.]MBY0368660.1 hypothetical protein [Burkholderiaceae bacterium]|mmetsp:Transcript_6471/g.26665  ORF Transcript_6471/g.26665 Transcript_6471/m.26665 type:complete len:259 (-) Transcript_6471:596-1372(-)